MERLIFTNARGQTVIFSNTGTYRWTNVDDLGGLTATSQTSTGPYQDGATPEGEAYLESKILTLELLITSRDLKAAIRNLNSILNPKLGIGKLTYEIDGNAKEFDKVRTRMLPSLLGQGNRGYGFQITSVMFEVFDPIYKDVNYTEAQIVSGGNFFSFPLNITDSFEFDFLNTNGVTVTNRGDIEAPLTIIMDGPLSSPVVIENMSTGEKIVTQLAIAEGERLTVITEPDNLNVLKTIISTGEETVAFQYIDTEETEFFNLQHGTNTLRITAAGAEVGEATIKFKNRYVGV